MAAVHYVKGDIFEAQTQVIVNTVNCKGIMGKGLALAFKQKFPDMFVVYQQECKTGKLRIGRPSLYKASTPWILNFPTKDSWKANSKIEYLEKGLEYFVANYKKAGITSIAFPKLGTQNGKLSWDEVSPLMVKYLSQLDIDVYIYIADGDREYQAGEEDTSIDMVAIWKRFNELSFEQLQQELSLNKKDAQRILHRRMLAEITSMDDIDSIEGLAKISRKRIKDYIQHQIYPPQELPAMGSAGSRPSAKKNTRKKKTSDKKVIKDISVAGLLTQQSLPEPEVIAALPQ